MSNPKTKTITSMSAYVAIDPDDNTEGVVAMLRNGIWTPMVGADEERIKSLRPLAEEIAIKDNRKIKLVRFTNREEVEDIK